MDLGKKSQTRYLGKGRPRLPWPPTDCCRPPRVLVESLGEAPPGLVMGQVSVLSAGASTELPVAPVLGAGPRGSPRRTLPVSPGRSSKQPQPLGRAHRTAGSTGHSPPRLRVPSRPWGGGELDRQWWAATAALGPQRHSWSRGEGRLRNRLLWLARPPGDPRPRT